MNSMTGFGQASLSLNGHQVSVEVSSLNKKNLEILVNTPKEWQSFEFEATAFIRKKVSRGRVRVQVKTEPIDTSKKITQILKSSEFNEIYGEFENFCRQKEQEVVISPESILQLLQFCSKDTTGTSQPNSDSQLINTLAEATEAMIEMRKKEGSAIAADFSIRLKSLENMVNEMEAASKDFPEAMRKKLLERLQRAELEACPLDERVLKELALYSEKFDVTEEITRLKSHLTQFRETCSANEAIGRKLEFILQEISRELNTFCSKSSKSQSTAIALEARVEIEKIREQAMNIE